MSAKPVIPTEPTVTSVPTQAGSAPSYSLWQLFLYAPKLGAIGFGGPVVLVGYMHRDLVEDRGHATGARNQVVQHT